jgi:hypothetical protein
MSPTSIAGIFLIVGATLTMRGNIYYAVLSYLIADACWLIVAVDEGNTWSLITVGIGSFLGLLAFIKMHRGTFHKSITKL